MSKIVRVLKKREDGFTLIELLVVIAIIGLIAAFVIPKTSYALEFTSKTGAKASAKSLQMAFELYAQANAAYPSDTNFSSLTSDEAKYNFIKDVLDEYITFSEFADAAYKVDTYSVNATTGNYSLVIKSKGKKVATFTITPDEIIQS